MGGQVVRMEDSRLPKQIFYGELSIEKRPQHKAWKRCKDIIKDNIKTFQINVDNWEGLTENRTSWRKSIRQGFYDFEKKRVDYAIIKRALRKQEEYELTADVVQDLKCHICMRILLSSVGYVIHLKSHEQRQNEDVYKYLLPPRPTNHTFSIYSLICKSAGSLNRKTKLHKIVQPVATLN